MWGTNAVSDTDWTNQASILPFGCTEQNLSQLHPSGEKVPALCQMFIQNCDKLIKTFHVPSLEPLVFQASQDVGRIPKGLETLMMVVYFNVVVSLSPEQCLQGLDCDRVSFIQKFNFATEQALARARLLQTDEITVLQAFAIFLTAA
jgi:hypothetical protein